MELELDDLHRYGVEAHKAGKFLEATKFYNRVLKVQSDHPHANHSMGLLTADIYGIPEALPFFKKALDSKPDTAQFWLSYMQALVKLELHAEAKTVMIQAQNNNFKGTAFDQLERQIFAKNADQLTPPADQLQFIINLYSQGHLKEALSNTHRMLNTFPYSIALCNLAGACNMGLMKFDAAIGNYRKVIKINPDDAEAYYNMGVALAGMGDLSGAIEAYKQALNIMPNYAQASNNLGVALKDSGNPEAAIEAYKHVLMVQPDHVGAQSNLLDILTSYTPKNKNPHLIETVNQTINAIKITDNSSKENISDDQVIDLFSKLSDQFVSEGGVIKTKRSQTYRKSSVDLNCKRHMSIFKQHNIIPEFCFGCYKVQVEPQSIIDLIKLYLVFDQLELNENNSRKCMVELRPAIPGFYKGLIFCASLEQAKQIAEQLDVLVKQRICLKLSATVKRGCSEYPISFPEFKNINPSGPPLMNYPEDWKIIEQDYDKKTYAPPKDVRPSLLGLNLRDVLVIQRWIDYAKGLGDPSANLVNPNTIYDQRIYKIAKTRLDTFSFKI